MSFLSCSNSMRAYQIGEELTVADSVMPARFFAEYTTLTDEQVTGIPNAQPDIRRTPGIAGRSDYFSSAIKSARSYRL